jgi:DNA-binding MarR family transcriptional regulator
VARYYTVDGYSSHNSLGYLARRALHLIAGRLETVLAEGDIGLIQWIVLNYLHDGLASTAAEMSRDVGYDAGAFTRIIDQLEGRGLLERQRSTADRRVVALSLTPAGRATIRSLKPHVVECYNDMLAGFSRAEAGMLIDLLTRFVGRVAAAPAPAKAPRRGRRAS